VGVGGGQIGGVVSWAKTPESLASVSQRITCATLVLQVFITLDCSVAYAKSKAVVEQFRGGVFTYSPTTLKGMSYKLM
jgi:hypothetical protein